MVLVVGQPLAKDGTEVFPPAIHGWVMYYFNLGAF
jgi:hypothetical protein